MDLKEKIKKNSPASEFVNSYPDINNDNDIESDTEPNTNLHNNSDNDIDNDIKDDNDYNINTNSKSDNKSVINSVFDNENKKPQKKFVGLYLDSDVNKGLDELSQRGSSKKKGVKSKLVNEILRNILLEEGILKS